MTMKGIHYNTVMKIPSERLLLKMKARTAITCGLMNKYSSAAHMHSTPSTSKPKYLFIETDMRPVHKRLLHTPSLGFIGQGFGIQNHNAGNLLKENEDHSLFFAETFSSTTGNFKYQRR